MKVLKLVIASALAVGMASKGARAQEAPSEKADLDLTVQAGPAAFKGKGDGGLVLGGDVLVRSGYVVGGLRAEAGSTLYALGYGYKGIVGAGGVALRGRYYRADTMLLLGATSYGNDASLVPDDMQSGTVGTFGARASAAFLVPLGGAASVALGPTLQYTLDSSTKSVEVYDRNNGETGDAVIGDNRWSVGLEAGLVFDL